MEGGEDAYVVDPATDRVQKFASVLAHGIVEGNLLLADKRSIRRVDWATLALQETVTTPLDINVR